MEIDWWRKRDVMASNRERDSFRWDWSSRGLVCTAGTAEPSSRSLRNLKPARPSFRSLRNLKPARLGRTSIDSEVYRQDFSNSVDIGTQRRCSEVVNNQPVRNGFISPLRRSIASSVNVAVQAVVEAPAVQHGGAKLQAETRNGQHRLLRSAERKRVLDSGISPVNTERRISSASGSSVNAVTHVDPELPALRRSSRVRSAALQVPQESQTENRKRKHPSSVSAEPVSSSPGSSPTQPSSSRSTRCRRSQPTDRNMHPSSVSRSTRSRRSQDTDRNMHPSSISVEPVSSSPGSSSTQPSSSISTRSRRSQGTDGNRQVESDEMLARQLQQELYNEMQEIVNIVDADASVAWQIQAPRRTDGGGAAAAARTDASILQIQLIERDFDENDYEMLLALDENNHQHSGASKSQISSLPQSVIQDDDDSSREDPCAICCDAPAVGDAIRHLPCSHKFHKHCIDLWLERKPSCPICKSDVR